MNIFKWGFGTFTYIKDKNGYNIKTIRPET